MKICEFFFEVYLAKVGSKKLFFGFLVNSNTLYSLDESEELFDGALLDLGDSGLQPSSQMVRANRGLENY